MVEVKNAAFKFKRFKIPTFSYNEAGKPKSTIRLDFVPSGRYFQEKGFLVAMIVRRKRKLFI
jgi:hypothetical protein